ncbi:ammonia transport outward protein 2 [Physcomitrium patens]|uniref:Uncharacterized protein n=1 Tax=Physcomitrium patens TaxID=3218 RepID=A0A2K1IVC2_PHYPA|nr:ammonia transport outward protein 2-like [Physcomitrium patens]XP_024357229.1 ammonia transport outward protein 2-like [Physcomitrium patens]XP_024357231.1 ammonia transport outward protein 2-like [Physcomitrium patens]PNR33224.1 hypothetical protein PHYPA_025167 [Physcomitrium patens]|eukprot:XP_024357228.1 ammonia transport outward protein 2-like [Physcomitrella patens]
MAENGQKELHDGPDIGKHVTHPPAPHFTRVANPAPLGLMGFALTTFVLSCYNAGIFGISVTTPPNVVTGLALFYGGLAQLLAGMWEFRTGNTFGATAFTSYGAFWLSYAAILIPWFGVHDSYLGGYERDVAPAIAIFLLGWTIFTFMMWFGTLRANVVISALFAFLTITFLLLTIAEYKGAEGHRIKRAGGFFGIFTAIIAWYLALAGLLTRENSLFTLPVGNLNKCRHG